MRTTQKSMANSNLCRSQLEFLWTHTVLSLLPMSHSLCNGYCCFDVLYSPSLFAHNLNYVLYVCLLFGFVCTSDSRFVSFKCVRSCACVWVFVCLHETFYCALLKCRCKNHAEISMNDINTNTSFGVRIG